MNWIELHTNTRYSDVLSFIGPQQILSACARNNCRAVAITDRNTVQAYLTAEQAAKKNGIALIYGLTIDCLDRDDRYAVTLLAKNLQGRDHIFDLIKLMKENSAVSGRYVTRQQLEEHRTGLLMGASAVDGQLVRAIQLRRNNVFIRKVALTYDYIELPLEPYDVSAQLCRIAADCHIPVCAVQNATLGEYTDDSEYHAYCAIAHFWGKNERAACYMSPEDLAENFRELYILPEEQNLIRQALEDGPKKILSLIEPMPSLGELMETGRLRRHTTDMVDLRKVAMQKLEQQYGQAPAPAIRKRLDWELDQVDRAGAADMIRILQDIRAALGEKGGSMLIAGTWNSSFLLYLLGVTDFDPLPVELSDEGYNLCCAPLFCVGDDLLSAEIRLSEGSASSVKERLATIYGDEIVEVSATNRMSESEALVEEIIDRYFLENRNPEVRNALRKDGSFWWNISHESSEVQLPGSMPLLCLISNPKHLPIFHLHESVAHEMEMEYYWINVPHIRLLNSSILNVLEECERRTGVRAESIQLDSPDVYRAIISEESDKEETGVGAACLLAGCRVTKRFLNECRALRVHDIGSLCRALSLDHGTGTWVGNQCKLYEEGRISAEQIIACREDIYRYLNTRGASTEESVSFMNRVRMGKIKGNGYTATDLALLDRCEAENWFVSVCREIDYLFPESHSFAYAILLVKLVWYVLNYGDVINPLVISTANLLLQEEERLLKKHTL